MELKQSDFFVSFVDNSILIEPFGIETKIHCRSFRQVFILIEPFGIETFGLWRGLAARCILIEPFGIETIQGHLRQRRQLADFNRTIWN